MAGLTCLELVATEDGAADTALPFGIEDAFVWHGVVRFVKFGQEGGVLRWVGTGAVETINN